MNEVLPQYLGITELPRPVGVLPQYWVLQNYLDLSEYYLSIGYYSITSTCFSITSEFAIT